MARVFTDAGGQTLASASQKLTQVDSFSLAFWAFRTATPAAVCDVIGTTDAAGSGWYVIMQTTNLLELGVSYATTDKARRASTALALNAWVHVLITYENRGTANTDILFYINGKLEAGTSVTTASGAHSNNAHAFTIGQGQEAIRAAPITYGPVAFWSRALSAAEALALAAGAHPLRFREGLVEAWDLSTATIEEGYQAKLPLIQGATNPTSAVVNPAIEQLPLLVMETRQNVRPMIRSRARYTVAAGSGIIASTTQVVTVDGAATTTVDVTASSSKTVAIAGAISVTVAVVADSAKPVPIGGSAAAAVGVVAQTTKQVPIAGAATATVLVQAQSLTPVLVGGSASTAVLVQAQTTKQVPVGGSITGVIGNPPVTADSLAQVPIGGSVAGAIAIAALSSRQVSVVGFASAQVLVFAQAIGPVSITGLAAAMVGVAAQSARAVSIGGLVEVSVTALNNGRYLTTAAAAASRYKITGFSRSRFQLAPTHRSQHKVEDSSSSSLQTNITAASQFTIRSTT